MKPKTRLLLFNLLIVLFSVGLIFAVFAMIEGRSNAAIHDIEFAIEPPDDFHKGPEIRAPLNHFFTDVAIMVVIALILIIALAIFLSNFFLKRSIRQQQEAYDRARLSIINGISHDLRTPLTVVKGNIRGIQDGVANTSAKRAQYLEVAARRVDDIESLFSQLINISAYGAADFELHRKRTNLVKYLPEVISQHELVVGGQIVMRYFLPARPVYVSLDRAQFKRVLDNLIGNAKKHNPDRTQLVMDVGLTAKKHQLILTIKDNGGGVKAENLPYIFDEFFKEDAVRNQKDGRSSGLGLAIARQIVEQHGWRITAENQGGLSIIIAMKEMAKGEKHA